MVVDAEEPIDLDSLKSKQLRSIHRIRERILAESGSSSVSS